MFGSSGTAAGCLSWDVWWLRTGSMGFAIFLSAKSCCKLSWERRLHLLHLLRPVLLRCCWLQPTSFSSIIELQPPLLYEGWGGHPLGTVQYWWISISLELYSSLQYSFYRFNISRSSVRHFPERSWTVVAFPCFTVLKSFTSSYTLILPLMFLRFFNLTTLFTHPVFFCFFHAHLEVVVHFPVFLRSFRFKSFLSQFSLYIARIDNFYSGPGFFSSNDVCQGSHRLFQSLLYWRWWSLNPGLYLHCS